MDMNVTQTDDIAGIGERDKWTAKLTISTIQSRRMRKVQHTDNCHAALMHSFTTYGQF